jgi:AAA family ATPase
LLPLSQPDLICNAEKVIVEVPLGASNKEGNVSKAYEDYLRHSLCTFYSSIWHFVVSRSCMSTSANYSRFIHILVDRGIITNGQVFTIPMQGSDYEVKALVKHPMSPFSEILPSTRIDVTVQSSEDAVPPTQPKNETQSPIPIGGLDEQLETLKMLAETALVYPDRVTRFGLSPPRGCLLSGPPGTGKTLLARHLAQELKCHVELVQGASIMSRYVGEAEAAICEIFERARDRAPTLIFFDEIDALCPKRDGIGGASSNDAEKRLVSTLLTLLDGASSKDPESLADRVFVLAATNRPNVLDDAIRRPGRLDMELEIGVPSPEARFLILKARLSSVRNTLSEGEIREVAGIMHGYVGADVAAAVREAGVLAVRRAATLNSDSVEITVADLKTGFSRIPPSVMREVRYCCTLESHEIVYLTIWKIVLRIF